MARNPPWTTDEILLALSLYFERGQLDDTDPEVIELSHVMNALPINVGGDHEVTFRNPNGVAMKLGNFAHFDPAYPGTGLRAGSRRDRELFDAYTDRRDDCHRLAQAIREGLVADVLPPVSEEDDDGAIEGALLMKMHRQRERKPGLPKKRKKQMRDELGQLHCEVCGLDEAAAAARYGDLTGDVFECHHRKPLYTLPTNMRTFIADLAVVCPTCHRALHRIEPMIDVPVLRARVEQAPIP